MQRLHHKVRQRLRLHCLSYIQSLIHLWKCDSSHDPLWGCRREDTNIRDFKHTHVHRLIHCITGFQIYTRPPPRSPSPSCCPPPWLPRSQQRAFPSYSQLNVFGGFNQGFARSDSILHGELKCVSIGFMHKLFILERCTAKSPLLIFGWLLCKSIPAGEAKAHMRGCRQLVSWRWN